MSYSINKPKTKDSTLARTTEDITYAINDIDRRIRELLGKYDSAEKIINELQKNSATSINKTSKVTTELDTKANQSSLDDTNTTVASNLKSTNAAIALKADQSSLDDTNTTVASNLKSTNAAIALKADQSSLDDTNTTVASNFKSTNAAIALKANQSSLDDTNTTVASNLETTNAAIALKADQSSLDDTNTTVASNLKSTNAAIALKANQSSLDETNTTVATKADKSDVYTKTESDNALNEKANVDDIPTVPTDISAFNNDAGYLTGTDIAGKEDVTNKVTSISGDSTDTEYPSAKAVYDALQSGGGGSSVEISTTVDENSTDATAASSKAVYTVQTGIDTKLSKMKQHITNCRVDCTIDEALEGYIIKEVHFPVNGFTNLQKAIADNPFNTYIKCPIYVDLTSLGYGVIFTGNTMLFTPRIATSESEDLTQTEHFPVSMYFECAWFYDFDAAPVFITIYVDGDATAANPHAGVAVNGLDSSQTMLTRADDYVITADLPAEEYE